MDPEAPSETRKSARNLALFPAEDLQESASTTDPHIRLDPEEDRPMESLARPVLICGTATDALSLNPPMALTGGWEGMVGLNVGVLDGLVWG